MMLHSKKLTDYLEDYAPDGYICKDKIIRAYVPQRYEIHDLYSIGEFTSVMGIFQIEVDGEKERYNLLLPAMLNMQPSTVLNYTDSTDGVEYYVLIFQPGDIFLQSRNVLQQKFVLAKLFIEFIRNGRVPSWMTYDQMATIFDVAQITCAANLPVPHAVMEMIIAHCCRDRKNLQLKYRLSNQKELPVYLGLRDTSNVRDSVTSRIIGSYFMDGINSSIVNQSEQSSEVEDLLRM